MDETYYIYEPLPGDTISHAAKIAIQISQRKYQLVCFNFNGVDVIVDHKKDTVEDLVDFYRNQLDIKQTEWENSTEGIAHKNNIEKERNEAQKKVNFLLDEIYLAEEPFSLDSLIDWVKRFSLASDHVGVKFDYKKLSNWLRCGGFSENWGINQPEEFYGSRFNMGGYIVGQVIDMLDNGFPPRQVCIRFCDDYFKLPSILKLNSGKNPRN